MNLLPQIQKHFSKVDTPRYLDLKIQEIALNHLKLKDVGELRDKFDAQLYLNNLSQEIRAEFAFEKFLGMEFDFEKRMNKNYKRLEYKLNNERVLLIPFSSKRAPILNETENSVIIYLKPEKFAYIGPLFYKKQINKIVSFEMNPLEKNKIIMLDQINFDDYEFFRSKQELINILNNKS
ncbi:hypothetical protein E4S40_02375 [Algoriphagus kandeliae]|uniref:Uncharacterized protein n=1 Tax=Algoriphagus kandeliae TaxID=2562278 RepID=A0A4Y9QYF4_9BACT|nr:hypothetical protein [Algoriphagus kandeliae]TFV97521.1 hypothetical protein E4S40_02375 [Algoriphagus kandeliae]